MNLPIENNWSNKIQTQVLYSFMPDGDWTQHNGFNLYVATEENPLDFRQIKHYDSLDLPGRDMSLYQDKKGIVYGAVTSYDILNNIEVTIYKGLLTPTRTSYGIDLGIKKLADNQNRQLDKVWAPEFFEDWGGSVYLLITANDRGEGVDKTGEIISQHSLYRSKIDLETMTATETVPLDLNPSKNYIDPHVYYSDKVYHLYVKDDYNKVIDYYRSIDFENWELVQEDFISKAIGETVDYTEGTFLIKIKETYYFFFDKHVSDENYSKNQYVITSKDLKNFTKPRVVTDKEYQVLRHGSGIIYRTNPYHKWFVLAGYLGIFILVLLIRYSFLNKKS